MIAEHDIYENDYARFWFTEGIYFVEYKSETTINLKVAQCIVADRMQFQDGKAYPILCDIRGIADSDKAGRDYLAHTGSVLITAAAMLIHEQVSLTISDFYLQINKPTIPTQVFTSQPTALAYLKPFASP
ncbi:DUF7793 family protein [Confluentibacter sediminis]|uniref:DUF7793 family protein n=1 Tax=Confluentibacter sediminis TaxID=2219045 RepID=UPI000DAEC52D|nr:hypothetical protein [Confluentibacter sediminis]